MSKSEHQKIHCIKNRICSIEKCGRKHHANGFCGLHNARNIRHGNPLTLVNHSYGKCIVSSCIKNKNLNRGFCYTHYHRFIKYGDPLGRTIPKKEFVKCKHKNCERMFKVKEYCYTHYRQIYYDGYSETKDIRNYSQNKS